MTHDILRYINILTYLLTRIATDRWMQTQCQNGRQPRDFIESSPVGCYHPHPPPVHFCLLFCKHSPDGATGRRPYKCCLLLIYRPRGDERLNWPSWLTYSRWVTHISG